MPIRAQASGDDLGEYCADRRAWLGEADWFDAHTHMGADVPDGVKGTPSEILAGLWPSPRWPAAADDVLARAQQHVALAPADDWAAVPGALLAQALCGTPEVGAPAPPA